MVSKHVSNEFETYKDQRYPRKFGAYTASKHILGGFEAFIASNDTLGGSEAYI